MLFGLWIDVDPRKEPCVRYGSRSPQEGALWGGDSFRTSTDWLHAFARRGRYALFACPVSAFATRRREKWQDCTANPNSCIVCQWSAMRPFAKLLWTLVVSFCSCLSTHLISRRRYVRTNHIHGKVGPTPPFHGGFLKMCPISRKIHEQSSKNSASVTVEYIKSNVTLYSSVQFSTFHKEYRNV